jgi:hypothetical protein
MFKVQIMFLSVLLDIPLIGQLILRRWKAEPVLQGPRLSYRYLRRLRILLSIRGRRMKSPNGFSAL